MRRLSLTLLLLLVIGLIVPAAAGAAGKSFVWQSIDTEVQVQPDGRLLVAETLTLRYQGGPFTFVKRNLPSTHLDAIADIVVRDGERAYERVTQKEGKTPYTFSVFTEDGATTVRWVHPPASDAERTFTLTYTVLGGIARLEGRAEVWWPFVFPAREEIVEQASGEIRLPAPVPTELMQLRVPDWPAETALEAGVVYLSATDIPAEKKVTVLLGFPAGSLGGEQPAWQVAALRQAEYDRTTRPGVDRIAGLITLGLTVALVLFSRSWWVLHRDPRPAGMGGSAESEAPPANWPPALVARLVGGNDSQAVSATLFDLTRRGYILLREEKGGWLGKVKTVVTVRTDKSSADLAPFEIEMLDLLFGEQQEAELSKRSAALIKALPALGKQHTSRLTESGYLDPTGLAARKAATILGLVAMLLALVAGVAGIAFAAPYTWWLMALPCLFFAAGIAWLLMAASIRGVTPAGAEALAQWRAFARYLKRLRPERAPLGHFEAFLPYAVALADAGRFIKAFKLSDEPLPAWFHPMADKHGGDAWANVGKSLLLRDYSDGFSAAAVVIATSSGGGASAGGGGAGGGAGGGSAG